MNLVDCDSIRANNFVCVCVCVWLTSDHKILKSCVQSEIGPLVHDKSQGFAFPLPQRFYIRSENGNFSLFVFVVMVVQRLLLKRC